MKLESGEAREYAMRSAKRRRELHRYCIEGEYVTVKEIALRIGDASANVKARMKRMRAKPGSITWAKLRQEKQP